MKFFICLFTLTSLLSLTSCYTSSLKKSQEATNTKASKKPARKKVEFTEKDKKMLSAVAVCLTKDKHCKLIIHAPTNKKDKFNKLSCQCADK